MSRMTEAAKSLQGLLNEFGAEVAASETLSNWLQSVFFINGYFNSASLAISTELTQTFPIVFRGRCVKHLGQLGDTAMDSRIYEEAVRYYSDVLSLDPPNRADLLNKREKARILKEFWEDTLTDANEVCVVLYPLCFID